MLKNYGNTSVSVVSMILIGCCQGDPYAGTRMKIDDLESVKVSIVLFEDVDRMTVKYDGGILKVRLRGLLPFSQWPKEMKGQSIAMNRACNEFVTGLFLSDGTYCNTVRDAYAQSGYTSVDLNLCRPNRVPGLFTHWSPTTPAALAGGWAMYNMNVLLVQEGYSPYVGGASPEFMDELFSKAEGMAIAGQKGIWNSVEVGRKIKEHAMKAGCPADP